MTAPDNQPSFFKALPFYLVFLNIPIVMITASFGGWTILAAYAYFLVVINFADLIGGLNSDNLDPTSNPRQLFWYSLVTWIWPFAQVFLIFFCLYRFAHFDYTLLERMGILLILGISSGIAGIVIAHELIHRPNRYERFLGDLLLGSVMYGHFRTEHVLVHHRYVATPRDAVTARYNEGIYHYFARAIPHSFISAWRTEKALLARKNRPVWHRSNPFYLYATLTTAFFVVAYWIGGFEAILQFMFQSACAILLLETTNYIEHYGLCRLHLGDGKYEHVQPRHSWNANHRVTNYLMINLQRHSDHHYKPLRRFPLLQALEETEAPQLPHGYIMMAAIAYSPYHWRKIMNDRVRRWRSMYYPQITDWRAYNRGELPWPR